MSISNITKVAWALLLVWTLVHVPGVLYGTRDVPIQATYIGDEQVSVNSALRVFNERSILAFRNREMQYYGPMLVMFDAPGVALDFLFKYLSGSVYSAEEYKNYIIWDWGGIIKNIRVTAVISTALGLVLVYLLGTTETFNPRGRKYLPLGAAALVAVNYYYFEWSHFSLHWAYVIPLLLAQLYTLVRIVETGSTAIRYWAWHVIAVVVSFGVSYFSLIFLSMWLPWLFVVWRQRKWVQLRTFAYAMTGVLGGWLLIVLWHPYAFVRMFSFAGIGGPLHNQGSAANPFDFTETSFYFYATQLVLNHLSLVLVFLLLLFVLRKTRPWASPLFWTFLLPGIANYVLFAPQDFPEGRYLLPTIISFLVTTLWLVCRYIATENIHLRIVNAVLIVCVMWYALFHVTHGVLLASILRADHNEVRIIQEIIKLQEDNKSVLLIGQGGILGYPHTKEAYRAFAEHRGFGEIPLYREIYKNPLPQDKIPLNVRYMWPKDFQNDEAKVLREWDHVIILFRPREGREWVAQTYFDQDLTRLWYYRELSPQYQIVK